LGYGLLPGGIGREGLGPANGNGKGGLRAKGGKEGDLELLAGRQVDQGKEAWAHQSQAVEASWAEVLEGQQVDSAPGVGNGLQAAAWTLGLEPVDVALKVLQQPLGRGRVASRSAA
jgi:hypothetical protein